MQPTSPLLQTKSLDSAIEKMINNPNTAIFSIFRIESADWNILNDRFEALNNAYTAPIRQMAESAMK